MLVGAFSLSATISATATGAGLVFGFIDFQIAAVEIFAVHTLDSSPGAFLVHFDEAEAAKPTCFSIGNEVDTDDFAESGELGTDVILSGIEGKVSNIEFLRQGLLLLCLAFFFALLGIAHRDAQDPKKSMLI